MTNKRLFFNVVLALVITITCRNQAFSENQKKTYVLGVENIQSLPYYTTVNSEYGGFARELFDLFAQHANIQFEYRSLPVNRLFLELVEKKIDFKYPDNPKWHVDIKEGYNIVYSDATLHYIGGAMVLPERKGQGVDQIKDIGFVMGFTPLPFLDYIKTKKMKPHESRHLNNLLKKVMVKRVDAAYININLGLYQLREVFKNPAALVFDPDLPYGESFFSLSTIKHPNLIKIFNRFLEEKSSEIRSLKIKFDINEGAMDKYAH